MDIILLILACLAPVSVAITLYHGVMYVVSLQTQARSYTSEYHNARMIAFSIVSILLFAIISLLT